MQRKPRRAHKKLLMNVLLPLLINLWVLIHSIIDAIIDFMFGLYYDSKKNSAPPVSTPLVMESAISLAQKIRNKEVGIECIVLVYISLIYSYVLSIR